MVSIQDQILLYDARITTYSEAFEFEGSSIWRQFAGFQEESFWGMSEVSKFRKIERQLPPEMSELHRHNFLSYCQIRMCLEMILDEKVTRQELESIVAYMLASVEGLDDPPSYQDSGKVLGGILRADTQIFKDLARYRLNQGSSVKEVALDLVDPNKLSDIQTAAGFSIVLVPVHKKCIPTKTLFYLNHRGDEKSRDYEGIANIVRKIAKELKK